jgi:hypothetical protein
LAAARLAVEQSVSPLRALRSQGRALVLLPRVLEPLAQVAEGEEQHSSQALPPRAEVLPRPAQPAWVPRELQLPVRVE